MILLYSINVQNMFTSQQEKIIYLLQRGQALSLEEIASSLQLNKSSVKFQLVKLLKEKIIEREQISTKKIYYKIKSKSELEKYIRNKTSDLELILISNQIEGIEAYKDLLKKVAFGKGDIIGYVNMEHKFIPELVETITWYRNTICAQKRFDKFLITNTKTNLTLLKDHMQKAIWKKYLIGKVIEQDILNVNCDIYCWDGNIGVCNFENNKFIISYHTDPTIYQMIKGLLENLFNNVK